MTQASDCPTCEVAKQRLGPAGWRLLEELKAAREVVEAARKAFERRRKETPEHWWILEEDLWNAEAKIEAYDRVVKRESEGG